MREPANRGDGRLALRDRRHAGHVFGGLRQVERLAGLDVRLRHNGGSVGRRGLDGRRRAGRHDHTLLEDRLDRDRHRPVGRDRRDGERPHVPAAGQDHENFERWHRRGLPHEDAARVGDLRDVRGQDRDLGADDRRPGAFQDDPALEGRRRARSQKQKRGHRQDGPATGAREGGPGDFRMRHLHAAKTRRGVELLPELVVRRGG